MTSQDISETSAHNKSYIYYECFTDKIIKCINIKKDNFSMNSILLCRSNQDAKMHLNTPAQKNSFTMAIRVMEFSIRKIFA